MDQQAYTVDEFCQAHRLCRATLYNILKRGDGPRIMKVGSRTFITIEAAAAWRAKMEAQAAEKTAA